MIIEYFNKDTEKPYWFRDYKYDNVFVMEWIYDEHEHSIKEIIIITVEWLVRIFGKFDGSRFDISYSDEDQHFSICFRDEEDAMIFKWGPPLYKTVRYITQEDRKSIEEEFGYNFDDE